MSTRILEFCDQLVESMTITRAIAEHSNSDKLKALFNQMFELAKRMTMIEQTVESVERNQALIDELIIRLNELKRKINDESRQVFASSSIKQIAQQISASLISVEKSIHPELMIRRLLNKGYNPGLAAFIVSLFYSVNYSSKDAERINKKIREANFAHHYK